MTTRVFKDRREQLNTERLCIAEGVFIRDPLPPKKKSGVIYHAGKDNTIPILVQVFEDAEYHQAMEHLRLHDALAGIWAKIAPANALVNERTLLEAGEGWRHWESFR